jgi:hypothetical protein
VFTQLTSAYSGAGGGGINTGNVAQNGGSGFNRPELSTYGTIAGGTGGTTGGNAATTPTNGVSQTYPYKAGIGGAGGGAGTAGPGGNGGNGIYGGGGGGGGACVDGNVSGAGGNGGAGYVQIITYF